MPWVSFRKNKDAIVASYSKIRYAYVYFELPVRLGPAAFKALFGETYHGPAVLSEFSGIHFCMAPEEPTLKQASAMQRGCAWAARKDIPKDQITSHETFWAELDDVLPANYDYYVNIGRDKGSYPKETLFQHYVTLEDHLAQPDVRVVYAEEAYALVYAPEDNPLLQARKAATITLAGATRPKIDRE